MMRLGEEDIDSLGQPGIEGLQDRSRPKLTGGGGDGEDTYDHVGIDWSLVEDRRFWKDTIHRPDPATKKIRV